MSKAESVNKEGIKQWKSLKRAISQLNNQWSALEEQGYEQIVRNEADSQLREWISRTDLILHVDLGRPSIQFIIESESETEYYNPFYINYVFRHFTKPPADTDPKKLAYVAGYLREIADQITEAIERLESGKND